MKSVKLFYKKRQKNDPKLQLDDNPSFVLLSCIDEYIESVIDELLSIPVVTDVKKVEGMYDMVVTIRSDSGEEIKQAITNKIRLIKGVRTSLVLFGTDYLR